MPNEKLEIINLDVNRIIPYWRNPRRNDKTVDMLIGIIKEYGFRVPIVVDKNYVVVKGHARLKAAKRLGMKEVPVIVSSASPEAIKADRIADNKIQEMSYWDLAKLELEYQKIGTLKFDKVFHPEALDHVEVDISGGVDFKPEGLEDGMYGDDAYDGSQDALGGSESDWNGSGDGIDGETFESVYGANRGDFSDSHPTGVRKIKAVCPYCGEVTYVAV